MRLQLVGMDGQVTLLHGKAGIEPLLPALEPPSAPLPPASDGSVPPLAIDEPSLPPAPPVVDMPLVAPPSLAGAPWRADSPPQPASRSAALRNKRRTSPERHFDTREA